MSMVVRNKVNLRFPRANRQFAVKVREKETENVGRTIQVARQDRPYCTW